MRSKCVVLTLAVFLVALGCHKRVPVVGQPHTTPPASTAPPPPPISPLEEANRAFAAGHYDDAARGYENYLRGISVPDQRDRVLFQLALSYALRPTPTADWPRAAATFKQLIDEYPNSPLKAAANLILSLHTELDQVTADSRQRDQRLKQLTTELDRLKKIDADRRKRP